VLDVEKDSHEIGIDLGWHTLVAMLTNYLTSP
jgi:hypothetical protein